MVGRYSTILRDIRGAEHPADLLPLDWVDFDEAAGLWIIAGTRVGDPGGLPGPLDANALVPAAQSRASTLHADDPFEGNTGGGEDTLGTYTLPGDTVAVGDRLRIFAALSGNNTDNVTGKLHIGATSDLFISGGNQISSGGDLFFYTDVYFTSAGNQVLRGPVFRRTGNTIGRVAGTPAEDETGNIVIQITGENTSDSSSDAIILDWWCIEHWRAA